MEINFNLIRTISITKSVQEVEFIYLIRSQLKLT